MTHIVNPKKYLTKKAFIEAVNTDPNRVYLDDPAIVGARAGSVTHVMQGKDMITVTNHPKRSWFAKIQIVNGKIKVT